MPHRIICVLGGHSYTDIDVLASACAYQQALTVLGQKACAYVAPPWNQTIPSAVRSWEIDACRTPQSLSYDAYVLVDVSDPAHISPAIDFDKVMEVFDHHAGYEALWRDTIGVAASIEGVGACATLIWERYRRERIDRRISAMNANLLYTAIISNTLNFASSTTTERDREAADNLLQYTRLPDEWISTYYHQVEREFAQNTIESLLADTKIVLIEGAPVRFAQMEVWDSTAVLPDGVGSLHNHLPSDQNPWIVNCVSIKHRCCYVYCSSTPLLFRLQAITSGEMISSNVIATPRLWLRKEYLSHLRCGFLEKK